MELQDYLIRQEGKNWSELLSDWVPPLPPTFDLWMVNRFGDIFFVPEDGSVHLLDVGNGIVERLADSCEDFAELCDQDDNATGWLLTKLVDGCVRAGMQLRPQECYGFKVPPILGGAYLVENVVPTDMAVHYSFLADIYRQTKDLPDGTRINVVVK